MYHLAVIGGKGSESRVHVGLVLDVVLQGFESAIAPS